jgi:hypothetical protein
MLVVTIDLVSARTGERSMLGRMFVCNEGTGTPERGNYTVEVCRKGSAMPSGLGGHTQRTGEVKSFPRKSYNVWRLISRALLSAFPEEA